VITEIRRAMILDGEYVGLAPLVLLEHGPGFSDEG
jgi:hypothetical protein